jgi:hypothetical protein
MPNQNRDVILRFIFFALNNRSVTVTMMMLFSSLPMNAARRLRFKRCLSSTSTASLSSLFNPSEEHIALRSSLRTFVEREVSIIYSI